MPGAKGLVNATSGISSLPSIASMTAAIEELVMQCAQGYSGCIGVASIGCQVATRSVAGLPSMSPLRIAVIGRQNSYLYLASKTAIIASIVATETSAIKRALSSTLIFLAIDTWRGSGCVARTDEQPEARVLGLSSCPLRAVPLAE